ncbi:phosphate transport system permease protein PstA [Kordiimonas sediminis]|uniref:Phosphate transport system permease protein PstA n=1 Tax=Kordiimonas sediminis TaxID=1735581 RepID=A0A919AK33_9PROT|nr:phosphate ABC transporter permease PstA [Kordiimonas sediminis]GHF11516.1 phosphate transport system permease protein PstA [Kordiimonas sediminis]
MTDTNKTSLTRESLPGLNRRYRAERRFHLVGKMAVAFSLAFLTFLIGSIVYQGIGAFFQTEVRLEVPQEMIAEHGDDGFTLLRQSMLHNLPDAKGRSARREAYKMAGEGSDIELLSAIADQQTQAAVVTVWIPVSDDIDMAYKSDFAPDMLGSFSDRQKGWLDTWVADDRLRMSFNTGFLVNGDSRDPERAGIGGALMGSIFTLVVCLVLSFVIGILAAIYLEEFAPKNKLTAFLEVNINNLATVPSIIFGLLGLAVFLNTFGLPRSSALVGGMVLSLMTLPTIIIASRVALQSVPPSIREAALGLGATHIQAVFHHVLPLALPGMLTGTILGMARALGETAPLLMIGMVAFIADPPSSFMDPTSALPVQVYLWADSPERAFAEKTSGAIIVLLLFLFVMNLTAIILRKKLEKKW